jgi:hypothetical protein
LESSVPNYFFDFLLPPDFFLLEDLELLDSFDDPTLDLLADDFLEPLLDLLAEDDLLFLD